MDKVIVLAKRRAWVNMKRRFAMANWLTEQDILDAHYQFGKLNRKMVRIAMGPNWPLEWEYIGIFDDEHDNELRSMGNLADIIRATGNDAAAISYMEDRPLCVKCGGFCECEEIDD